jgi:hypothetical protein
MAVVIETAMAQDLDLGVSTTSKTHQSGGTLSGHQISLSTLSTKGASGTSDTTSWDPGLVGSASRAEKDITVQGAALGDFALATFDKDLQGCGFSAYVSAANTVTCVINNNTGSGKTILSGTLKVLVFKTR